MRKVLLLLMILGVFNITHAQIININNPADVESDYSLQELVEQVLIGGDCAIVDSFSEQVFGQPTDQNKSYGYFKAPPGSDFPFEEGIILTTGNAYDAGNVLNGSIPFPSANNGLPGDLDLEDALQDVPGFDSSFDATFIKFNFVPNSSDFDFRFIMASEEYDGVTECNFADGFAFLLREVGTTTYENLAILPDGTEVSVTSINGSSNCPANTVYFEGYNLGHTNYGGRTVVLTASTTVDPTKTYEIKLVVADEGDEIWDSAIFLEAGSFDLGLDIGDDLTISGGNPACDDTVIVLDTEVPTTEGDHTWFKDGVEIVGETDTILVVTESGEYSVVVEYATNCVATDSILIEFTSTPTANPVEDQLICDDDNDGFWTHDLDALAAIVLGGQDASEFVVSMHSSQEDADNNTNGLPNSYTNQIAYQEETLYARIESTINTNCYQTTSFLIDVADSPFISSSVYSKCDDATDGDDANGFAEFDLASQESLILDGQDAMQFNITYHLNQADADANVNALPLLYTNVDINSQDIYVRLENVDIPSCYVTATMNLMVYPLPVVTSVVELKQCDNDVDGLTVFNLMEANSLISSDHENEIFTYYLTQGEAETGLAADQIADPLNYPNPTPLASVVYARVETPFGCFRTVRIDLVVGATQIPANFRLNYEVCDDELVDNDNTNGIAAFDFSDATAQIEALFPAGQNLTITYYENENDALIEMNAIQDISNYRNELSPFTQDIFVRVDSDVNACLGLGNHITLTVNPLPLNNPVEDFEGCSETDFAIFDLTTKDSEVIGSQTEDILISYHLTEQDAIDNIAITNPDTYSNTSNPQTIYVRAQFDTNGNGVGDPDECVNATDMNFDLVVIPNPIVFDPDPIRICSEQIETVYDLTVRESEITGGDTTITLTYFESQDEVDNDAPIADPTSYFNTLFNRDIIVLATGSNLCTSTVILPLETILYAPVNRMPTAIEECETDNDGYDFFDLTRVEPDILNGLNPLEFTFTYYENESDAMAGNANNIPNAMAFENTVINIQTIYARVLPTENECYIVVPFEIVVNPGPEIGIEDEYVICLDSLNNIIDPENVTLISTPPLDTQLSSTEYDFQWYSGTEEEVIANPDSVIIIGATEPSYFPMQAGDYTVVATDLVNGCTILASTVVIGSYPPESISVEVISPVFSDNNTLEVTVVGNGEYEYSLDSGSWQTSNIFEGVNGGEHVVYVRDFYNCDEISAVTIVIDYLRFFTPNGDGYFDTWNIAGIGGQPNAIIYIFDRYGKLIKELKPTGTGWDGTFNGQKMPSDSYWFTIEYNEPLDNTRKTFRGYFALKR